MLAFIKKIMGIGIRSVDEIKVLRLKNQLNAKGKNLMVFGKVIIKDANNIHIGQNCRLNDYVFLHGAGGLIIDDDVTISAFSKIFTLSYNTNEWKSNYKSKEHIFGKVYIGKGVWIGAGAIILPGVELSGKGIIVAAGSVVNKSFNEDFVLIGGNPARIMKRYSQEG
ncbi:dTDP-4-amino-4,6-dideoxy-D-glucose acyltransferase [compost metagenome]